MSSKAQFTLFHFIIFSFLAVIFFAGLIYIMGQLNSVFNQIGLANEVNAGQSGYVNMSQASQQIWGNAYQSIQALRMVAIVYILSLAVITIIIGAFERKYPFLFIVYILITVLAIIFAPQISNAYEKILETNIFGGELANFSTANYLLLNLPTIVMFIGILGTIFLLINLIRTAGEQSI
jgi:hypothetical protein